MAALMGYVNNQTMNTSAYGWGNEIDMSGMPSSSYADVAQNAMYTSMFYASNPGMLEKGQGASNVSSTGINLPQDIATTLSQLAVTTGANTTTTTSASSSSGGYGAPAGSSSSSAAAVQPTGMTSAYSTGSSTSAAGRTGASTALVAIMAVAASFAML